MSSSYGAHASSPQSTRPVGQDYASAPRPGTLKAMVGSAGLAAVLGLAGALVTFFAGRSMLRSSLLGALGVKSLGGAPGLVNAAVDAAYSTLQSRAILAVVMYFLVAALAFLARNGRTGARIGLTVALFFAVGIWLTNVRDGGVPGPIRALDGAAVLFGLAAIVLAWLPATQRFAGHGKARRRG